MSARDDAEFAGHDRPVSSEMDKPRWSYRGISDTCCGLAVRADAVAAGAA